MEYNFVINGEKKDLGKVFTPQKTVDFMINKLGTLDNKIILEPCAGEGIFIKNMIKKGCSAENIFAFDIDFSFAKIYQELGIKFRIDDFLLFPFDEHLYWPEKFDAIIGNPPYLSRHSFYIQKNKKELLKYFREIGIIDTYSLFIYKGIKLLKEKGILCFIISDSFLSVGYHKKLRKFILDNTKIKEIILAPKSLFANQKINVSSVIIVLEKCYDEKERNENIVHYIDRLSNENEYSFPRREVKISQKMFLMIENYPISININEYTIKLLNYHTKITEVLDGHIGLHTHNNKKYIAAIEGTALAKKFYKKGKIVIHKELLNTGEWRFYIKKGGENKYWQKIEEAINWNNENVKNYDIPKNNFFGKEGIIISGISKTLSARYMPKGCFWDTNKAIGFIPKNKNISIYYLLGLLNSKLYNYLMKGVINMSNCIQINDIRRLPFFYPDNQTKIKIEGMVVNIINCLRANPHYNYSFEQSVIDELIFSLYKTPQNLKEYIKQKF